VRFSTDEARTWSDPVCCGAPEGYFVVNNDRVVQLSNGRLVIPTSRHDWTDAGGLRPGVATCLLSDDQGRSWRLCESELHAPPASRSGLQEPGVVELKDGRLMMLCRTDQGCQFRSFSHDGGLTWSPAEPSSIVSPVSPATVKRIPQTGDLLLAWNNHQGIDEARRGKRTPFTVAISTNEGETWERVKTLEDDPDGWYCYTAMEFVGDHVLLGHCAGKRSTGGLNLTQITLFPVDWLYR
jgi:hypothetical protein